MNVCQRRLVNEVLGPLVTEFVPNFGREGATPIQRGSNASLLHRVQAIKLIVIDALISIPKHKSDKWLSKKVQVVVQKMQVKPSFSFKPYVSNRRPMGGWMPTELGIQVLERQL